MKTEAINIFMWLFAEEKRVPLLVVQFVLVPNISTTSISKLTRLLDGLSIKLPDIHKCRILAVSPYKQACLLGGHLVTHPGI